MRGIAWKGSVRDAYARTRNNNAWTAIHDPRLTDKKCRLCFLRSLFMRGRLHARTRAWNTTRIFFVESRTDFRSRQPSLRAHNSWAVAKISTPDLQFCFQCHFNKIDWNVSYIRNDRIISCHVTSTSYNYENNYNGFYCYNYLKSVALIETRSFAIRHELNACMRICYDSRLHACLLGHTIYSSLVLASFRDKYWYPFFALRPKKNRMSNRRGAKPRCCEIEPREQ